MKKYTLECCVDSVESAVAAQAGGANRLELCANLIIGGTTPSLSLYRAVRKNTEIPVHVLLRPRFGDFLYTDSELSMLREDARMFYEEGADGLVAGCLLADGRLNLPAMESLIRCAPGLSFTLHRAFDVCSDPQACLREAVSLGVRTILTSGRQDNCLAGLTFLKDLLRQADHTIDIMIGGGVNAAVIETFLGETDAAVFHMSGKEILESGMKYRNEQVHMGLSGFSEYEIFRTSREQVALARRVLDRAEP